MAGTQYGMANKATLVPVRVLDCNGSGTNAGVIAGVDWITANHVASSVDEVVEDRGDIGSERAEVGEAEQSVVALG